MATSTYWSSYWASAYWASAYWPGVTAANATIYATLMQGIEARLLAGPLGTQSLQAAYRRETTISPTYPYAITNIINEDSILNTSGVDYYGPCDLQISFVDADSANAEAMRDAAFKLFLPKKNSDGTMAYPPIQLADGTAQNVWAGRKREIRQKLKGPSGAPVWIFSFDVRMLVSRSM